MKSVEHTCWDEQKSPLLPIPVSKASLGYKEPYEQLIDSFYQFLE
jgi:hypothetical protein